MYSEYWADETSNYIKEAEKELNNFKYNDGDVKSIEYQDNKDIKLFGLHKPITCKCYDFDEKYKFALNNMNKNINKHITSIFTKKMLDNLYFYQISYKSVAKYILTEDDMVCCCRKNTYPILFRNYFIDRDFIFNNGIVKLCDELEYYNSFHPHYRKKYFLETLKQHKVQRYKTYAQTDKRKQQKYRCSQKGKEARHRNIQNRKKKKKT